MFNSSKDIGQEIGTITKSRIEAVYMSLEANKEISKAAKEKVVEWDKERALMGLEEKTRATAIYDLMPILRDIGAAILSPDGTFPFTTTDVQTHVYTMAGAYLIMPKVTDDDGGIEEIMLVIIIG